MVRKQHKFLCLVLCLALIVTTVLVGAVSVFAASGDKIYCKPKSNWSSVYIYMWNGNGESKNAEWPGQQMTAGSDGLYSYTLPGDFANVIFSNGSGDQTGDMQYPGANKVYDAGTGQWGDHQSDDPTSPDQPVTQQPTTPPSTDDAVYFRNTANWSTVKCYMWNSANDANAAWFGESMTDLGEGVWRYQPKKRYASCIFNNGTDQTADLTANYGQIFDYGKNAWEPLDLSDLRVNSVSADPSSGIYANSEVTLSADATNKNGATVYYKFSVTNAAGSQSVISDYSTAKSVTWTPINAGNYTVTFDFKDTEDNTNSRTLDLTVLSDAGVTSPIIQKVVPGNLKLVKKNAPVNVEVTAGGGKIGTNLLFYKYVVTDPNGVLNVPYYTLNKTYSFTPTKLGNYQVEVFVQASDNSTVSKTYTYSVTDSDIPEPTTQKPTDRPTDPPVTTAPPTDPTVPSVPTTTAPDGYQFGDADMDGFVNIKDATYIQKHCAEFADARYIRLELADMNKDGQMTVVDATCLQVMIAQ